MVFFHCSLLAMQLDVMVSTVFVGQHALSLFVLISQQGLTLQGKCPRGKQHTSQHCFDVVSIRKLWCSPFAGRHVCIGYHLLLTICFQVLQIYKL